MTRPRPALALFAIVALAIGARVLTYAQIREGPALHLHVWGQSDMSFFDRWARAVGAGDWLTRAEMRPYHGWQRDLACNALAIETRARAAARQACTETAVAEVWDRWVGRATFWQDPLYPYALALLYATAGSGEGVVYAAHALAGIACVLLVYSIAAALFGASAAAIAGAAAALYGSLLFHETLRLREVAIALATLAAVRAAPAGLAFEAGQRPRAAACLAAGLMSGVSVLVKASALLFALPLAASLAWRLRDRAAGRGRAGSARTVAAFAAGFLFAMTPLVARNIAVDVAPWSVASTGPLNFLNGNAADYRPGGGTPISRYALDILTRTHGQSRAVVGQTLATHESVTGWPRLLAAKLATFWRAPELPDNANQKYFELQAPWLRFAPGFGFVAPLALLGLIVGARKPGAWVALLNVGAGIAACVLFFNLGRFRLPIALGMLPFAGFALVWLAGAIRARRVAAALAGMAVVIAAAVYVDWPDSEGLASVRIADYGVHNEITAHLAEKRARAGDPGGALRLLERQLRTEPAELVAIEPSDSPTRISSTMSAIAGTFAPLHARAARIAGALGDEAKAAYHGRRDAVLRAVNAPYEAQHSAAGE